MKDRPLSAGILETLGLERRSLHRLFRGALGRPIVRIYLRLDLRLALVDASDGRRRQLLQDVFEAGQLVGHDNSIVA